MYKKIIKNDDLFSKDYLSYLVFEDVGIPKWGKNTILHILYLYVEEGVLSREHKFKQ